MDLRLVGAGVWLSMSLGMGIWTAHTNNRGNVQTKCVTVTQTQRKVKK